MVMITYNFINLLDTMFFFLDLELLFLYLSLLFFFLFLEHLVNPCLDLLSIKNCIEKKNVI
jgi:hypothetical protein